MHYDYDAIVVGARCAGASTAMLLAKRGHRVLLVDRARFPSEIAHGHFIHRHGPPRLKRWGLLEPIVATGCPPVSSLTFDFGDFPLSAQGVELDGVAWGYGPRRAVLDKILVDAAVEAGAELWDGVAVNGVLIDNDRVSGIRPAGSAPITARLTIGADGKRSRVAREVKAPTYEVVPALMCWYFTYFRDAPGHGFHMHLLPGRHVVFMHPTNDGLTAVFIGWPIEMFASVRADLERSFMDALHLTPELRQRMRSARRVERFYGTADVPNFLRKPSGPGWALVGDAACHKDPFLALGVCDALRDAELLADAAADGLSDAKPLDEALRVYQVRRDEATLADYRENLQAARLGAVPPEVLQLRRALRDNPVDTTRYFLARDGRTPREAAA